MKAVIAEALRATVLQRINIVKHLRQVAAEIERSYQTNRLGLTPDEVRYCKLEGIPQREFAKRKKG